MSQRAGPSRMHPDDPRFEEWCFNQLEEDDNLISDEEESYVSESEHDTESEQSGTEDLEEHEEGNNEIEEYPSRQDFFYGREKKNAIKWSKQPLPANSRTRSHNLVMSLPGLRGPAKALGEKATPLQVWDLLFSEDMLDEVMRWTNRKLSQIRTKYKNQDHSTLKDIEAVELRAFLGLIIYTEVFKAGRESLEGFFASDGTGRDVFRCTMPRRRFETLLIALRFDNEMDRAERMKDRAAAISGLLANFIDNSQKNFSLGAFVCVDESLVGFRGRCGFVMYMPKKPAKYGIKIMCLTDARNNYLYNAYIYCGKGSDSHGLSAEEKKLQVPTQSVVRLVKPIERTNRNVTADNWFSSLELVIQLQQRGLTFLGALKKNKPMIPASFLPDKKREIGSKLYGFKGNLTLLSHASKKNKPVLLISSMHHSPKDDPDTGKPEMIADYNMTKGGVDSLDKKCENYSSCRRTRRWPMALFLQMMNMCSINAYILYQSYKNIKPIDRSDFLKILAKSLITPFIERRYTENLRLPRELRSRMECLLQIQTMSDFKLKKLVTYVPIN